MELKEFIKSTVNALLEATWELQHQPSKIGTHINPAVHRVGPRVDSVITPQGRLNQVTVIGFDVAVTEGSSRTGKGGGTVNVAFFKAEGGGDARTALENVSRVKFDLRVTLPPDDDA